MTLVPDDEATVVVEPCEQALDLPAASIPAEWTAILTLAFAVREIRRDEFDPALLKKAFVQAVAVVGFVSDQPVDGVGHERVVESLFDERDFVRRST